jgi:hypothetical protein
VCPLGKYVDVAGSDNENDCDDCAAGTYLDKGTYTDANTGNAAANGPADGSRNNEAGDCIVCVVGKYVTTIHRDRV